MEPLVPAGMIEVPMRVDQMRHRLGAQAGQGPAELWLRNAYSSIDQHLSVRSCQHSNIAARALEDAYIASQVMSRDRRGCRAVFNKGYEPARLRKGLARREPAARRCEGGASH